MTITRVKMEPGATSGRHSHAQAEQIWIVEGGVGRLLMAHGQSADLTVGDIVRTPPGEIHGIENTGSETLVYLSVTTPPEDFRHFYRDELKSRG